MLHILCRKVSACLKFHRLVKIWRTQSQQHNSSLLAAFNDFLPIRSFASFELCCSEKTTKITVHSTERSHVWSCALRSFKWNVIQAISSMCNLSPREREREKEWSFQTKPKLIRLTFINLHKIMYATLIKCDTNTASNIRLK